MSDKFIYGTWRTDKPKEEGHSHELISPDSKILVDAGSNLDELKGLPFDGVDTILKAVRRNVAKMPNHEWIGTRVGDEYQWDTLKDIIDLAENFSHGMVAENLTPEIDAEDTKWKFIGIQSKNRKEWNITNLANMHQGITTVALYDTLGPDATRFVLNQTELTTMVVSNDYISKLS